MKRSAKLTLLVRLNPSVFSTWSLWWQSACGLLLIPHLRCEVLTLSCHCEYRSLLVVVIIPKKMTLFKTNCKEDRSKNAPKLPEHVFSLSYCFQEASCGDLPQHLILKLKMLQNLTLKSLVYRRAARHANNVVAADFTTIF